MHNTLRGKRNDTNQKGRYLDFNIIHATKSYTHDNSNIQGNLCSKYGTLSGVVTSIHIFKEKGVLKTP